VGLNDLDAADKQFAVVFAITGDVAALTAAPMREMRDNVYSARFGVGLFQIRVHRCYGNESHTC
jgi:hypothetical protein